MHILQVTFNYIFPLGQSTGWTVYMACYWIFLSYGRVFSLEFFYSLPGAMVLCCIKFIIQK